MYIIAIIVFVIMLGIFYNKNEVTNKKLLASLKDTPSTYTITDAIGDNNLVDYYGVITNLNLLYDFVDDCNANKISKLIFTSCNASNELVIKTALYKNGKIYVNIDNTRTNSDDKDITSYKFTDFELVNDDNKIQLTFINKNDEMSFFKYNKKVEASN